MTWLTVWNICVTNYHESVPIVDSFLNMIYHLVCNKSHTIGTTCGARTTYLSGAHDFTPVDSGYRVARYLVFCVVFCKSCLSLYPFSFVYYAVGPSSIYALWWPLWYLQTFLYRTGARTMVLNTNFNNISVISWPTSLK